MASWILDRTREQPDKMLISLLTTEDFVNNKTTRNVRQSKVSFSGSLVGSS